MLAYTNCKGCQDRNHPLEAQAYAVQDAALSVLKQYTKISNGQACEVDADCRTGSCYPGPAGEGKNYCNDRNTNCAMAGSNGVMAGQRFNIRGIIMVCRAPTGVGRAQILPP